jgi:hypothetical protein
MSEIAKERKLPPVPRGGLIAKERRLPPAQGGLIAKERRLEKGRGSDNFGLGIRAAVRGLWRGEFTTFGFLDAMTSAVGRGYERAWREGAKTCNILPEDRTPEEQTRLDEFILTAQSHMLNFANAIEAGSKANGGKLGPLITRSKLWQNRYEEVKAAAQQVSCQDAKTRWVLGPTEHCSTCSKLAGRVYRNSIWRKYDIRPRDTRPGRLACRGFNCQCSLVPTDEPVTPGRPPNVP